MGRLVRVDCCCTHNTFCFSGNITVNKYFFLAATEAGEWARLFWLLSAANFTFCPSPTDHRKWLTRLTALIRQRGERAARQSMLLTVGSEAHSNATSAEPTRPPSEAEVVPLPAGPEGGSLSVAVSLEKA